jgi:hypothetical protein
VFWISDAASATHLFWPLAWSVVLVLRLGSTDRLRPSMSRRGAQPQLAHAIRYSLSSPTSIPLYPTNHSMPLLGGLYSYICATPPPRCGVFPRTCVRGVVAFQEMAMPLARSNPDGAHFRQCSDWILATFARAGVEPDMGGKLFATFLAAGLPIPQMILAGRVEGGPDSLVYDYYADIARSLLPMSKHRSYGSLFSGSTRSGVMAAAGRRHLGNARRAAALRSFEGNGLGRIRSRGE